MVGESEIWTVRALVKEDVPDIGLRAELASPEVRLLLLLDDMKRTEREEGSLNSGNWKSGIVTSGIEREI